MIDKRGFEAEDFLIDSTFQHYCAGTDQASVAYWKKYIESHPAQAKKISEAEQLFKILSGNKAKLDEQLLSYQQESVKTKKNVLKISVKWIAAAASVIILLVVGILYFQNGKVNPSVNQISSYTTKAGERKRFTLIDGSTVILNSRSSLRLGEGFNQSSREVYLKGEAYFDVKHGKKPFKVSTDEFAINVLGTAFNVKAYPDEAVSEATLIRGVINMEANDGSGIITLKPSQKVTIYKKNTEQLSNYQKRIAKIVHPEIVLNHYKLIKDSLVLETAWTNNKLEIYDQSFAEVKEALEKWYNIEIRFTDSSLEKHRFTATFSNETITQVLDALKQVESFNYEIKGNLVTISK